MKIEKTDVSYQVTECDLKFGEQITLNGEVLIPISVFGKIKAEIADKSYSSCDDYFMRRIVDRSQVFEIIDKYIVGNKKQDLD